MADTDTTSPVETQTETPAVAAPLEEAGALADHERQYSGTAERDDAPAEPAAAAETDAEKTEKAERERDDAGKFAGKRHRAKSQQADPEDVPRIKALTSRLRETERELESLRAQIPAQTQPAADVAPQPRQSTGQKFPSFEDFVAIKGNEQATWDDYYDERARWNFALVRAQERAQEQDAKARDTFETHAKAYTDALPAIYEKYPDFDEVVSPGGQSIEVSKALERAVIEAGPETAYYLATHPEERAALTEDTLIDPRNPAFAAVVATTRRYLQTLVASEQRSSSSRGAAAPTGSALALVRHTPPKPPNPVRTSGQKAADAPPSEDASLAEHERAYGPKRQRA